MDPGTLLATTHDAGGLQVRLRLARPSDSWRLAAFLEAHAPRLAAEARGFTFYDPRKRLVVVATAPRAGAEQIVGLADLRAPGLRRPLVLVNPSTPGHAVGRLLEQAAAALSSRLRHAS